MLHPPSGEITLSEDVTAFAGFAQLDNAARSRAGRRLTLLGAVCLRYDVVAVQPAAAQSLEQEQRRDIEKSDGPGLDETEAR
jgi:hypothetical protein